MRILGISAFYHDCAAALVDDGAIVAAAQEERFTPQEARCPAFRATPSQYCLEAAGIAPDDLDHVAFYDKPFLKFERLLETYLAFAPARLPLVSAWRMPLWINEKLFQKRLLTQGTDARSSPSVDWQRQAALRRAPLSHAASAFYPSPFEEAAVLTMDGVGEWATTSAGLGQGSEPRDRSRRSTFRIRSACSTPPSPTTPGFKVNSGEYKVMGLAPYGEPHYAQLILEHLIDLKADGSFRLDLELLRLLHRPAHDQRAASIALFGGPPRKPGGAAHRSARWISPPPSRP